MLGDSNSSSVGVWMSRGQTNISWEGSFSGGIYLDVYGKMCCLNLPQMPWMVPWKSRKNSTSLKVELAPVGRKMRQVKMCFLIPLEKSSIYLGPTPFSLKGCNRWVKQRTGAHRPIPADLSLAVAPSRTRGTPPNGGGRSQATKFPIGGSSQDSYMVDNHR